MQIGEAENYVYQGEETDTKTDSEVSKEDKREQNTKIRQLQNKDFENQRERNRVRLRERAFCYNFCETSPPALIQLKGWPDE